MNGIPALPTNETQHGKIGLWKKIVLAAVALPLVVMSFFNQPVGDDYWLAALIRKYGILNAHARLYDTVSARYTALSVMAVNSLFLKQVIVFKLIPLVFLLCFYFVVSAFLKALSNPAAQPGQRKSLQFLAAAFTITYLAVLPGIGEGVYWVSSLCVYQLGIVLLVLWWTTLLRWHFGKAQTWKNMILSSFFFVATMGCNEILALLAGASNLILFGYFLFLKRRADKLSVILLALSLVAAFYIAGAPSFEKRYLGALPANGIGWWHSIVLAVAYAGYHLLKCFVNPFLWLGLIVAAPELLNFAKGNMLRGLHRNARKYLIGAWLVTMIIIELAAVAFSENNIVPLRISNMLVFFFLTGALLLWGIYTSEKKLLPLMNALTRLVKFRGGLIVLLLLAGFIANTNISTAARELYNGDAYMYNKEMNERLTLLRQCKTDTCQLPALLHRPKTIRYSDDDNDKHIGEYFNKTVMYK